MQAGLFKKTYIARKVFFVFIITVVVVLAYFLPRIALPFGIAYIMALVFRPFKIALGSVSLTKKALTIIFILVMGFLIFYPLITGVNTIANEAVKLEIYLPKLESYLRLKYEVFRLEVFTHLNYEIKGSPIDEMIDYGKSFTKNVILQIPRFFTSFFEWTFIIPIFLFFIIKDGKAIRYTFMKMVPNPWVEKTYYLYHQFNTKFGDYIFAKFIEATIVGVIITLGLWIIGFPFAFLLGIVAAITNIVPYVGPIIGFLPALIVGLVDQNPDTTLGAMVILYLVANIVDLALVFPLLVSKIVNLHPMMVIASVIIGSQFAGVIGMIISIPIAAFIKLLFIEVYRDLYGQSYSSLD